jgi:glycine/serine hydroxymethyltransferase
MKEREMKIIAHVIARAMTVVQNERLPADKAKRKAYLASFKKRVYQNSELKKLHKEIRRLCATFPIPESFI